MIKPLVFITLVVACLIIFLYKHRHSVLPQELPGTYILARSSYLKADTIVINSDQTFRHSEEQKDGSYYVEYGFWKPTVDGYYELKDFSQYKSAFTSVDIKPGKNLLGDIIIPRSADGQLYYEKSE